MFVLGLFCFCVAVGVFCHDTPIGKYLRAILIALPAEKLAKLTWAKTIVALALTALFLGALYVGFNVHDGVVVFFALPEAIAWMAAFDIATLLEVLIAMTFAAAYVRVGEAARFVASHVARLFEPKATRTIAAKRERRTRPKRPASSANDNDAPGFAAAYAVAA